MTLPEDGFSLDSRLAADTIALIDWPLCRVRLMNDARFPWLILVPRRPDVTDIDQLDSGDQMALWAEVTHAMAALRATCPMDKLNIGALGNIVAQLHVHIVARQQSDDAWPDPVWGSGRAIAYTESRRATLVADLENALRQYGNPRH